MDHDVISIERGDVGAHVGGPVGMDNNLDE
jgi:hypothetical protein